MRVQWVRCRIPIMTGIVLAVAPLMSLLAEDTLSRAVDISRDNNLGEVRTQAQIDALDEAARAMMEEYLQLSRESDTLGVYNAQLQRMIDAQEHDKQSLHRQMVDIDRTQQEIIPLMLDMVDQLEKFVRVDTPFLPAERKSRVEQLKALMDRPDVALGEKYRRVIETYQVEMDYGRTIEAYRETLAVGNETKTVDVLRIGRVGLYYLTLDRGEAGYWNASDQSWSPMPTHYNVQVRNGLRMAPQQMAPDLLRLPVSAPQEMKP